MFVGLLWLALLGTPASNLLPGDTAFRLGAGPFTLQDSPDLLDRPGLTAGAVRLPAPAPGQAGCAVGLTATPPLEDGVTYTFAARARGTARIALTALHPGGTVRGEFTLDEAWRTVQVTFTAAARPDALDAQGRPEPPRAALRVATVGPAEGQAWLTDLRLVRGPLALEVAPPELDVDVAWDPAGPAQPAWVHRQPVLHVRAEGPPGVTAGLTISDPAGQVVSRCDLPAAPEPAWDLPLAVPAGYYRLDLAARAGDRTTTRTRWLALLHDRTSEVLPDAPWALDAPALPRAFEARRLGYRRTRVVMTWRELADDQGRFDPTQLDRRLAPALAMGFEVVLALDLTRGGALPPAVVTARRMDSHGAAKGTALPDVPALQALATDLARHLAGQPVLYELDPEPYRAWHADDYRRYLGWFTTALRAGEPKARVAGLGHAFDTVPVPKLSAFFDEAGKRGLKQSVERVTTYLPFLRGVAPEEAPGGGWSALLDGLAAGVANGPRVQFAARANTRPTGPEDPDTVPWAPRTRDETLSPFRLAALVMREYLPALRVRPALFPTGWDGGYGPLEAALDCWQERYAGARFVTERSLGDGLRAVELVQPDGLGVAAVWDASDPRWSAADKRRDAPAAVLELPADAPVRAWSLYGRELTEARTIEALSVPLSFAPVYLESASPELLDRLLSGAIIRGQRAVRVVPRLAVRDGRPGLAVTVANDGRADAVGELRVRRGGEPPVPLSWQALAMGPGERFVPLAPVAGQALPVRVTAEAGWGIEDTTRTILRWPLAPDALPVVDPGDNDWPADAPTYRLATADRLLEPDGIWRGPDDAALTLRGRYAGGTLVFSFDITDNNLVGSAPDPFGADLVDLFLDFDLGGPADDRVDASCYRLTLAPLVDGQFVGRHRLNRGPGAGTALLADKRVRSTFRRTVRGWTAEVVLPLTPEGRDQVERQGFGFDVLLADDDGTGKRNRLTLFGGADDDRSRRGYAHVWLAALDAALVAEPLAPSPPPVPWLRVSFDPAAGGAYRLTPERANGAVVRWVACRDFVRGEQVLRAELSGGEAGLAEVTVPAVPAPTVQVTVWARASGGVGEERPRLGVRYGAETRWLEPPARWRRYELSLPSSASPLSLLATGRGAIELAEVDLQPVTPPARPLTGPVAMLPKP